MGAISAGRQAGRPAAEARLRGAAWREGGHSGCRQGGCDQPERRWGDRWGSMPDQTHMAGHINPSNERLWRLHVLGLGNHHCSDQLRVALPELPAQHSPCCCIIPMISRCSCCRSTSATSCVRSRKRCKGEEQAGWQRRTAVGCSGSRLGPTRTPRQIESESLVESRLPSVGGVAPSAAEHEAPSGTAPAALPTFWASSIL